MKTKEELQNEKVAKKIEAMKNRIAALLLVFITAGFIALVAVLALSTS